MKSIIITLDICKELINSITAEIKTKIIHKVMNAKYFSIIFDCTRDINYQEKISFILQYVDISFTPMQILNIL